MKEDVLRPVFGYGRFLMTAFILLTAVLGQCLALAQTCVPLINNPATVNGIVVGTGVVGGGGLPAGCAIDPGWGGVASLDFAVFGAALPTQVAKIFLAGYNAANDATLDTIYVGVHIEGDPELTQEDRVVLYFDANGNNTFDSPDFALLYEVGTATPPANEVCNQNPGTVQFFLYSGGLWVPQASVPASITSKVSWDYDSSNDGESEIWELEIGLDVSGLSLKAPSSGAGFKVGAKLYVNESSVDAWKVWRWPASLTSQSSPLSYDPNEGNVTAPNMAPTTMSTCGYDVVFEPDGVSGVTASSAGGESNKFTRLANADFNEDGSAKKKNHFTAKVKFLNPSNLLDTSPVAVPNKGRVKFSIKPWNGGFLGEYLMGEPETEFSQLNQIRTVQLDWPQNKNQYDDPVTHQPKNDLQASTHTCLKVQISGFTVDSNQTNDVSTRNLTYISTSTVRDTFVISTVGMEAPPGVETIEYILRANWKNVSPDKVEVKSRPSRTGLSQGEESPWYRPKKEKWNVRFPNAERIGLSDLGNGYFSLPMKVGEEKHIDIDIVGGVMPVASQQYHLSPRAGGKLMPTPSGDSPLNISVTPGKMVTIIAHGLINVDPESKSIPPNGPNGFSNPDLRQSEYLLPATAYEPSENIGAVIGSFDDFKTAFVIGSDLTFLVPEGAKQLSLAVNDSNGKYGDNGGEGFRLNFIMTDPLYLPTRLALAGNSKLGLPAMARAGSNLPELDIEVFQLIPDQAQNKIKLLKPTGYVAYAVYASHPKAACDFGSILIFILLLLIIIALLCIVLYRIFAQRARKSS